MLQLTRLFGVMIFSRFPIVKQRRHVFRQSGEKFSRKGFVEATLAIGRCSVTVFSCHLDAVGDEVKKEQVKQIAAAVHGHTDNAVIVAGDFNICPQKLWDQGQSYQHLVETMEPLTNSFGEDWVTFPTENVSYDHIFVPPNVDAMNRHVVKIASDHLALSVELPTFQLSGDCQHGRSEAGSNDR